MDDRFPSMAPIIEALKQDAQTPSAREVVPVSAEPKVIPSNVGASRGRWYAWYATSAIAITAITVFAIRPRPSPVAGTADPVEKASPPTCRVESTHSVKAGVKDRLTVLPSGAIIVARGLEAGIVLQRETPSGPVPFKTSPLLASLVRGFKDVALYGYDYREAPAVEAVLFGEDTEEVVLTAWTEGVDFGTFRIKAPVTHVALAPFGEDLVTVATPGVLANESWKPAPVTVYRSGARGHAHGPVEEIQADRPSIATAVGRIAVAYAVAKGIRFALLDEKLQRIGDVRPVTSHKAEPAVAFAAMTPVVFWAGDDGGKRRLRMASLEPGAGAFTPAKAVSDEPAADVTPVAAPLPGGAWAVGWVAASGGAAGGSTLRVSSLGPSGALAASSDVARGLPDGVDVRAASTHSGVAFFWHDTKSTMKVAHVTCDPPKPKP